MNIQSIQFHDQTIQVLQHEGKPYVAMKSIAENIGLDWHAQRQRIRRNEALNASAVIITSEQKIGVQRDLLCLPLGYLNGWLFGIEVNRVKPEIRETLKLYQLECYDVLYNHFLPEVAAVHPNVITTEQQHDIKSLVNEVSRKSGIHYQGIYTRLYDKFKIPRYQELPSRDYQDAVGFLRSLVATNNDADQKERELDIFHEGILKAGIGRYHELTLAQAVVFNEMMDGLDLIDQGRKILYEAGRKFKHIGNSTGIIYDAMAEPLARMKFKKSTREEAQEKAKRLARPFRLDDWS